MGEVFPNFTGYWKQVKNENFDDFLKVLGLPWTVRKVAQKFGNGSTELICQKGSKVWVSTVNVKGSWLRVLTVDRTVQERNAAGESVRVRTWWEGKALKSKAEGSKFGDFESWRYMEGDLMVVKSKVTTGDGREGEMFWFFEALPVPHRHRCKSTKDKQTYVWRDMKLVDKATRKDNFHLQMLLSDLASWETPADRFIQIAAPSESSRQAKGRAKAGVSPGGSLTPPLPATHTSGEEEPRTATQLSGGVQLHTSPPSINDGDAARGASMATSPAQMSPESSTVIPPSVSPEGPRVNGVALPATHHRVLSDTLTSDILSHDSMPLSCGDYSELPTEGTPTEVAPRSEKVGASDVEGEAAPSRILLEKSVGLEVPSDVLSAFSGVESPGVESPRSVKSVGAASDRRSGMSGSAIRATPRGTPKASINQKDLEKVLAWKINEFKDIRGIASVVPVHSQDTSEPELLQMSPEQAEETAMKLKELEEQAKLERQQTNHSCSCFCFMVAVHEFMVPDYLKTWEM